MSTGLILIAAILILGGVIATVGDQLGTRVGKARLSLFNLRPRKTAVLVTILTGVIISASTLGILLATSGPLRTGILEIETIQRNLRKTRDRLKQAQDQVNLAQKQQVQIQKELAQARSDKSRAQRDLDEINRSLRTAVARQARTEGQLNRTRSRLGEITTNFEQAQTRLQSVTQQAKNLRSDISQLQTEREKLLAQQNLVRAQIAERDQEIAQRDRAIRERETLLRELESQQEYLAREVQRLEREAQGLRQGNFVLQRGQVMASGVVRIVEPAAARQAVDKLLLEANRAAIQSTQPGVTNVNGQLIQITQAEVQQLIAEIDDGQDYVVRILSAANYLVGEKPIQVFADAVRNQILFLAGDVVAAASVDPSTMTAEQLQQQINLLIAASNFRARRLGILNDTVQIGRIQTVVGFIERLQQYKEPIDIKTVTTEVTYTAGPLKIKLVAIRNGEVLFSTQ